MPAVNHPGGGDRTLVEGTPSTCQVVTDYCLVPAADGTIRWKSTGGEYLTDAMPVSAGLWYPGGYRQTGHFRSRPGEGVVLTSDVAIAGYFNTRIQAVS